jgi:transposase-like protein
MSSTSKKSEGRVEPDPEVTLRAERRTFTAAYKQAILQECETCGAGEIGRILRREGLYSSHLTKWRRQRVQGELAGLEPRVRGPRPQPQQAMVTQLRQDNERLQLRLKQAEAIIDVQKKVSHLLGLIATPPGDTK